MTSSQPLKVCNEIRCGYLRIQTFRFRSQYAICRQPMALLLVSTIILCLFSQICLFSQSPCTLKVLGLPSPVGNRKLKPTRANDMKSFNRCRPRFPSCSCREPYQDVASVTIILLSGLPSLSYCIIKSRGTMRARYEYTVREMNIRSDQATYAKHMGLPSMYRSLGDSSLGASMRSAIWLPLRHVYQFGLMPGSVALSYART
jgi:hypothetical protein